MSANRFHSEPAMNSLQSWFLDYRAKLVANLSDTRALISQRLKRSTSHSMIDKQLHPSWRAVIGSWYNYYLILLAHSYIWNVRWKWETCPKDQEEANRSILDQWLGLDLIKPSWLNSLIADCIPAPTMHLLMSPVIQGQANHWRGRNV